MINKLFWKVSRDFPQRLVVLRTDVCCPSGYVVFKLFNYDTWYLASYGFKDWRTLESVTISYNTASLLQVPSSPTVRRERCRLTVNFTTVWALSEGVLSRSHKFFSIANHLVKFHAYNNITMQYAQTFYRHCWWCHCGRYYSYCPVGPHTFDAKVGSTSSSFNSPAALYSEVGMRWLCWHNFWNNRKFPESSIIPE